nr:STE/STE11 protein kinase [Cryptococcus depauperatus CBS 7855]
MITQDRLHRPPSPALSRSSGYRTRPVTPPLLKPPQGQPFSTYLDQWEAEQISEFLELFKCGQHFYAFEKNNISGKVLLDLDATNLKEMGISKIGERMKLMGGIKDLRRRASESGFTNSASVSPSVFSDERLDYVSVPMNRGRIEPVRSVKSSPSATNVEKRTAVSRPPPLDLQHYSSSKKLPQAYQNTALQSHSDLRTPVQQNTHLPHSQSTVPHPNAQSYHINLRAPPQRDTGRRSPNRPATAQTQTSPTRSKFTSHSLPKHPSLTDRHPFAVPKQDDQPKRSNTAESSSSVSHSQSIPSTVDRFGPRAKTGAAGGPLGSGPAPSLEDLRRQLVKFVSGEDGTIRTVNVSQVTTGVEILERALKKFGKWGTGMQANLDTESEDGSDASLEIDGWGVYVESNPSDDAKPLSENSLLKMCLAHRDGTEVRDRNLFLHRTRNKSQRRKNIHEFFGDIPPPPMSPSSPTIFTGPRLGIVQDSKPSITPVDRLAPNPLYSSSNKHTNRASMISVMSGLGAYVSPDIIPSPTTARSSSGSVFANRKKSMYNFFGHRPPSELISNHLADYFPSAKKSDVEKARHSMLRLSSGANAFKKALPLTENNAAQNNRLTPLSATSSQPPSLPPFEPSQDSLADSLQAYSSPPPPQRPSSRPKSNANLRSRRDSNGSARSRMSTLSHFRRNRDRSDTASLLTVDEITAEVENRRASTIVAEQSNDTRDGVSAGDGSQLPSTPIDVKSGEEPASAIAKKTANQDESGEDEFDSSEEEGSTEDENEESDREGSDSSVDDAAEQGKAYTSTGSKRIIKWIKGALIGAGSFGSVYLGMDAQSGLLMAVKQVELFTGSQKNDERKKSMLDALEREIELLKELQHDNIVQYLGKSLSYSSVDTSHLNIFLEYVPGGSVAALLNNYGAFEEALVRNFVRQIVTGLNYLHERGIIHRDIKGANILVDNKGGIKISDFGISKKMENNLMTGIRANRPSLQGSVFWMAPEVVKQTSYTSKADIWSVGCLVVEMLTGTHPWADLTQMQAIFRIGSSARPTMPSDISSEAADFLQKTFEIDHTKRPTAGQLLAHSFIGLTQPVKESGHKGSGGGKQGQQISMMLGASGLGAGLGLGGGMTAMNV